VMRMIADQPRKTPETKSPQLLKTPGHQRVDCSSQRPSTLSNSRRCVRRPSSAAQLEEANHVLDEVAILVLIALGGFAYIGPAQFSSKRDDCRVAQSAAQAGLDRRPKEPTHTSLSSRPCWAAVRVLNGDLADVLRDPSSIAKANSKAAPGHGRSGASCFFGPPGTRDTIVWSDRHQDRALGRVPHLRQCYGREYSRWFGDPELEPALVFDLTSERGHEVYRMYLRPAAFAGPDDSGAPKVKPGVLAYFPVALLRETKARGREIRKARQEIASCLICAR